MGLARKQAPDLDGEFAQDVRDEGYVDALVRASLHLIRKDFPHEVRGHGVRLLQHLMRFRWEEVSIINWSKFADVFSLLGVELGVLDDLVWKNAAADLVAEVVWSHGISLLHDLIPCLVCLSAKRATELLEKHVGAVLGEKEKCQVEVAEEHASVVKAVLDAAITYAGWAHVVDLGKHGLIKGEFFLMQDYLLCPHTTFHYVQALHGALSISASPKDYCSSSSSYSNISGTVSQNTSVQKRLSCESSSNNKSSTAVVMSSPDSCITLSTQVEGNDCELDLQVHIRIALEYSTFSFVLASCDTLLTQKCDCWRLGALSGNDGARRSNSFHHVGCLLLAEQNLISEAFLIVSSWSRQFVKNVHDVVKSWEGQLKRRAEESHAIQMPDKYSYLQCVHALWNREITFDLSKKLAKAKRFGIDEEEGFQEIEMRQWLQDIRESGMLHHGRARVPYHFGNLHGSLEIVRKLEETLLLEFTREDLVKEQKEIEDAADSFTCWLVKQKEDLHAKACSAPPKEFFGQTQLEWNWEVDFFDLEVLYKNLRPEFRSKYAIDSSKHPHLRIMSNMREGSDHYYEIVERIGEKIEIPSRIFDRDDAKKSIRVLLQILHFWEPQFHPLIREGHKDFLLDIARRLAKAKATEYSEPLIPQMEDFLPHLQPYAFAFIVATLKDPMGYHSPTTG
ncbi:hypothetical protein EE612_055784, partial [Oryza sativa]